MALARVSVAVFAVPSLFDSDLDPTSVGTRFRKYPEIFKIHAVAMNQATSANENYSKIG